MELHEIERIFNIDLTKDNNLRFIGRGGAFDSSNSSAYMTLDNTFIIIDAGEQCATQIMQYINAIRMSDIKRIVIMITHQHSDHIGALSTIHHYVKYIATEVCLDIICAESVKKAILGIFEIMGNEPCPRIHIVTSADNSHKIDNMNIKFVQTEHVLNFESYGILMSFADKTIYYSGDSTSVPEEAFNTLYDSPHKRFQLFQDMSLNENVYVHMGCSKLVDIVNTHPFIEVYPYHNSMSDSRSVIEYDDILTVDKLDYIVRNIIKGKDYHTIVNKFNVAGYEVFVLKFTSNNIFAGMYDAKRKIFLCGTFVMIDGHVNKVVYCPERFNDDTVLKSFIGKVADKYNSSNIPSVIRWNTVLSTEIENPINIVI